MLELKDIPDSEYFTIGSVNIQNGKELVLSASLIKEIYGRGLYETIIEKQEYSDELLATFELGTMLHSYILEYEAFNESYYFGDFNTESKKKRVPYETETFIKAIRKKCKVKFPDLLDEVGAEIAIVGDIDNIPVKCKMDKFIIKDGIAYIYDLKSTFHKMAKMKRNRDGVAWEIAKIINELNYDLQMFFYKKLVEEWLHCQGLYIEVVTILVFASTTDEEVRMIRLSEETLGNGEEKYNQVIGDVKDFYDNGIKSVNREELV